MTKLAFGLRVGYVGGFENVIWKYAIWSNVITPTVEITLLRLTHFESKLCMSIII